MKKKERERERIKREGKNPIIELAHWRMTIQKGAARIEMPLASILNSLLARDRSRSQAFVVCVSMMKYERVTCSLDSHSLPFLSIFSLFFSFFFFILFDLSRDRKFPWSLVIFHEACEKLPTPPRSDFEQWFRLSTAGFISIVSFAIYFHPRRVYALLSNVCDSSAERYVDEKVVQSDVQSNICIE